MEGCLSGSSIVGGTACAAAHDAGRFRWRFHGITREHDYAPYAHGLHQADCRDIARRQNMGGADW